MEKQALSRSQAHEIAEKYKHLEGKPLIPTDLPITYVAVGPYNKEDDINFVYNHHLYSGFVDYEYHSPDEQYSVWTITYIGDSGDSIVDDIRLLLSRMNIDYDF